MTPTEFATAWQRFANAWSEADRTSPADADALVLRALADGIAAVEIPEAPEADEPHTVMCAANVLLASGQFDEAFYRRANPAAADSGLHPAVHYAAYGWHAGRAPRAGFEPTWYARTYLGEAAGSLDPLLFHVLAGVRSGNATARAPVADRPPLTAEQFMAADAATPSLDDHWAFPVCAFDHTLAGNDRAVFEQVRHDASITKVVLTRSREIDLDGPNVHVLPLGSRAGQEMLIRSRFVFTKHGPFVNVPWSLAPDHDVINLWHGIPLKRFGYASLDTVGQRESIAAINGACRAVISSSRIDAMAMAAAFYPLTYEDIWVTGLPRNDHILCPEERLPADLAAALDELREELAGRRLVLFLPTFRNGQAEDAYAFNAAELDRLAGWMERHGAVLGVREHMADRSGTYTTALGSIGAIDLSAARFPDLEVLYRLADGLVSDYSSCMLDFSMTGRPIISFAYDLEHYAEVERGLFYDLDHVLPGPVCRDFDQLAAALDRMFEPRSDAEQQSYAWRRGLFFDHLDDGASARVVERVRAMSGRRR